MAALSIAELGTALTSVKDVLQADGYDLDLDISSDESVRVEVVAGPDACKDCLVPKDLFTMMMVNQLTDAGISLPTERIDLIYPNDQAASV